MSDMSDFEQLKPCPFCGSHPNEGSVGSSVPGMEDCGYLYIECRQCNETSGKPFIGVHGDDKEVLRGIWNTRAAKQSMQGEVKFDLSACLSSVADMGFWPQVIYDDNGNWAIWDEGSSNMRLDDDMDYHCSFLIPAKYFKPSLQEAWSSYVEKLKQHGNDVSELYTHAPDLAASIAELEAENEALRVKAARYDWIEKQANKGATNFGQILNQNLLNGHRHRNRLMYSFLIRANNSSDSVDLPLGEAIDAALNIKGGAE